MSLADPAAAGKLLPKKDKTSGPLKLKKSIAKKTKPKDGEGNGRLYSNYLTTITTDLMTLPTQKPARLHDPPLPPLLLPTTWTPTTNPPPSPTAAQ